MPTTANTSLIVIRDGGSFPGWCAIAQYLTHLDLTSFYRFTGSAGIAIITLDSAYLSTDSRFWIQAEEELDSQNWTVIKSGYDWTTFLVVSVINFWCRFYLQLRFIRPGPYHQRPKRNTCWSR